MRFVPDALHQVHRLGRARQQHRGRQSAPRRAIADVDLLVLLGQSDDGQLRDLHPVEHLEGSIELSDTTIDND